MPFAFCIGAVCVFMGYVIISIELDLRKDRRKKLYPGTVEDVSGTDNTETKTML